MDQQQRTEIDEAIQREAKAIEHAEHLAERLMSRSIGISQFLAEARAVQASLKARAANDNELMSISAASALALDRARKGQNRGLKTGFDGLDELLGGLREGNLVVLGAYTGAGKSMFAMQVALEVARTHEVAFVSYEMSAEEVGARALACLSGVPTRSLLAAASGKIQLDLSARAAAKDGLLELEKRRLLIYDTDAATLPLLLRFVETTLTTKPDLLVVDHVHLMTAGLDAVEGHDVGTIARELKKLAKREKIPVLAVAQMRKSPPRDGDARNREPQIEDLKDSSELMHSANAILLLWDTGQGGYQLMVKKNRSGPTGEVFLTHEPECARFVDWVGGMPFPP